MAAVSIPSPMAVALAIAMAAATAVLFLVRNFNNWYYSFTVKLPDGLKLPPGTMGVPLVGEMADFLRCFRSDPDSFITKRIAKYGRTGIFKSHLFSMPSVLAVAPEVTRFVLADDKTFPAAFPGSAKMYGANSVAVLSGPRHIRLRKYITDGISAPQPMRDSIAPVTRAIRAALKRWSEEGTVVLESATKEMMFNIILASFMSIEPTQELTKWMVQQLDIFMGGIRSFPLYFPGTSHYAAVQAKRRLMTFISKDIKERREKKGGDDKHDFLQSFMATTDENGFGLTDEEVSDNMVSFLLAGFRATAYMCMWLAIFVARDPDILEKLRAEHLAIRNSKPEGELLTLSDINTVSHYTANLINETVRKVSFSPMGFRVASKDVDYKGFRIPKGWRILVWNRALHQDPANFHQPQVFNPDRWDEDEGKNAHRTGAFNAYGYGVRKCPGIFLIKITGTLFLHYLSLDYKWENVNPDERGISYLPQPKPKDDGLIRIWAR